MSQASWTSEQLEAINRKGCNLLVAAAAGAGKTAVLVERIIRKITDPVNPIDIDSLLVVTFTNAAAAEMRERVGLALEKALEEKPDFTRLQQQLVLLGRASITTIHSFCLDVLRSNFHLAGIDPVFRIADETETVLMKLDILEELFEERYEDEAGLEEFHSLVERYGSGRNDKPLQDMVLMLYEFVQSHPWPEKWLEEKTEAFNISDGIDFSSTVWGRIIVEYAKEEIKGLMAILTDVLAAVKMVDGLEPYIGCLEDDLTRLDNLLQSIISGKQWNELYEVFNSFELKRLPKCSSEANPEVQELVKEARKEVKAAVSSMTEKAFNLTSGDIISDMQEIYPVLKSLSSLASEFGCRYSERKRSKALLDFNDLEHLCLKVLTEGEGASPAALALREKFTEILVDEYQDSNLIQEVIINIISRREQGTPNVFMVGDVKQSIYRFRQARPELFMEKYNTYSLLPDGDSMKILLYKNFRSRTEVIDCVNFIFKRIMSEFVGELDYSEKEALNAGAVFAEYEEGFEAGGPVEALILDMAAAGMDTEGEDTGNNEEDEYSADERESYEAVQSEALMIAARIKELVSETANGQMVFDKALKMYRKADYKDVVILLRTTRNWAEVIAEELTLQDIPVFTDTGSGYFETVEIQTIMSLLKIIDNPLQDIPLIAVLRSPIYGFTADELVDIRLADEGILFYEALKKYVALNDGTTAEKAAKFLEDLSRWRVKAAHMATDELIWFLYTDTTYYSYVGVLPGGIQRRANLKMLYDRAGRYGKTSYKGLFNFICFVDRLRSSSGDMGSAKILGESENVVRIMSIHKSKGLEFPIVFVSGCGKKFNLQDLNGRVLLHQELGFGPDLVDPERRTIRPLTGKQAIKYKVRRETLSEEMRILYVALTRAREKLIITSSLKDYEKTRKKWAKCSAMSKDGRFPEYEMLRAGTYMDWIGACLETEEIKQGGLWRVKVYEPSCFNKTKQTMEAKKDVDSWLLENNSLIDEGISHKIYERLDWSYSYKGANSIPAKISVSELKRLFNMDISKEAAGLFVTPMAQKPAFMDSTKGFSASEKGSIMHFVMQHLDLDVMRQATIIKNEMQDIKKVIKNELERLVKEEFITLEEAQVVDVDRIGAFFTSPLGIRMVSSGFVRRETPFNIEIQCREVYPDCSDVLANEKMLLQGAIDCFFEEEDGLVLLDYKTDRVINGKDKIKDMYAIQLKYYARALESITGKLVKEKYIYLFQIGELIKF